MRRVGSNVVISGQGRGLTVISACDLGEACHLGLFPMHAITAKGRHSQTGSRIQQVPSSYTPNICSCIFWRVFNAPPGVACWKKMTLPPPLRLQAVRFLLSGPILDHFCPCVMALWTNFQFCSFVTTLLTTLVHASRFSGRNVHLLGVHRCSRFPVAG